jgi:hypothetical protein
MKTIPLPAVPREMQKLTDKPVPTYRRIYLAVLDGTVKAEQQSNGRYRVDADLTPILERFGLKA